MITPRTLSGFRDYLPAVMLAREEVLRRAREVYRSYGFTPIDTPACESLDVLLGKGGDESDKLVYRVLSARGDKAEMGLRFDLTVPFARFSAQYINELGTPFKRYAMGPVWRGERPGQGRYREFWQCDFDTIGTTSNAADIETALVINDLFTAIGFDKFEIRVNNRKLLNGLLEAVGLRDKSVIVLRAIDKLDKIGRDAVLAEMTNQEVSLLAARNVLDFTQLRGADALDKLEEVLPIVETVLKPRLKETKENIAGGQQLIEEGIAQLRELLAVTKAAGVPEERIKIDLSIARGLDYYTGTIYETFLTDLPGIGSVCSGGRYDNLASKYTKQVLPGVGASLGVDRLIAAMEELKHPLLTGQTTPAQVLVVNFDATRLGDYQRIARALRAACVNVEVYPDTTKKIGTQFAYAEKRGFKLAVVAGPAEFEQGVWKVKDLAKREEAAVPEAELVERIKQQV
ncbi:histidine--tRNA ligase [Gemmata massiliana]|uniref:histidine--tRNA ligase n=1 Tax=Gemmata massiliana TaxID=1210884 RepID=UPI0036F20DAA